MPSSTIVGVSPGTIHHVVAAIGINAIDTELPTTVMPSQRTVEILQAEEFLILVG
jgi:hypothetical protein